MKESGFLTIPPTTPRAEKAMPFSIESLRAPRLSAETVFPRPATNFGFVMSPTPANDMIAAPIEAGSNLLFVKNLAAMLAPKGARRFNVVASARGR